MQHFTNFVFHHKIKDRSSGEEGLVRHSGIPEELHFVPTLPALAVVLRHDKIFPGNY